MDSALNLISSWPWQDVGLSAVMFVVVLAVLVFFHELGHYLAARSVGAGVHVFSIGFGKPLFSWFDKVGTRWQVAALPLGGYVSIKGMEDGDSDDDKDSFNNKSVYARMWVVFAGPFANFLLAFLILAGLFIVGEKRLLPQVGTVIENMPAQAAGLQPGDIITHINGQKIIGWDEMREVIQNHGIEGLQLQLNRNGQTVSITLTPELAQVTNEFGEPRQAGQIGITPSGEIMLVKYNPVEAVVAAGQKTWELTAMTVKGIQRIFSGSVPADQIGGPLMIAELSGDAAKSGGYSLLMLMVLISINLGLINLFPIPVLDGGHLVFYAVEAIKGSPVSNFAQEISYRFGMGLIVMLMCFAFYNDIMRIVGRVVGA